MFFFTSFTIWNPLNHVERKSITSHDETRIVDQRVHVLWQFNVDKPTKTYKNRLQHGRTWMILATENHFGSSSMFINDSSRLKNMPGAIVANQSHSGNRRNSNRRPFEGKDMAFGHKKWPIESRVTQETHSETLGFIIPCRSLRARCPCPIVWLRKALSSLYFHSSGISMDIYLGMCFPFQSQQELLKDEATTL